jgi:histone H3/H4
MSTVRRRSQKTLRDPIYDVTKPGIRRLARRAGVTRVGGLMYDEMRGMIKVHIEDVVQKAVIFMQYRKRRTLSHGDVKEALKRLGMPVWGVTGKEKANTSGLKKTAKAAKKTKARRGSVALKEVKKYQKSESLLLSRAPIERLIRTSMHDFTSDGRIEPKALSLIQVSVENLITNSFKKSHRAAIHDGRKGVKLEDARFVSAMEC